MKNLNYIFLLLIAVSCRAQSPVINLRDWKGEHIMNSYLKDDLNDLNEFEGTYIYTNADTLFTIKLKKVIKARTIKQYEDLIVGEVEYKIGTTTLLNTLNKLNTTYFDQRSHSIAGSTLLKNNQVLDCPDCVPNEIRLRLKINDTRYVSAFYLKRTTVNSTQALRVFKRTSGPRTKTTGTIEQDPIIRDGDYIFIKQP